MKLSALLLLPLVATLLPFSGCASSPSGGASVGRILNRLESTLTVRGTLDQNAYYAVAFDDTPGDGTGPGGIDKETPILNGVVNGNYRVAIIYHLGQFEVYYRPDPTSGATERRVLTSTDSIFAVTPRATSNGITFILNLDARLETTTLGGVTTTTYFFPHSTADSTTPTLSFDRMDLNFVTTNVVLRNDNSPVKPVDAAGFATISGSSAVSNFQINTTRGTNITDSADDFRPDVSSIYSPPNYDTSAIDVTNLQINVTRGR